jgi:hypothetical protein
LCAARQGFTRRKADQVGNQLLRVTSGPQPFDLAVAGQPIINGRLVLEPFDVVNFGSRTVRLDLPVTLRNSLRLENDAWRFAHPRNMQVFAPLSNLN